MYEIILTSKFKKDVKCLKKRGYDIGLLTHVIKIIASGSTLPARNKDHYLSGNLCGFKECHISPDWLLVYSINNNALTLVLSRTGSHSDLFK